MFTDFSKADLLFSIVFRLCHLWLIHHIGIIRVISGSPSVVGEVVLGNPAVRILSCARVRQAAICKLKM
jgi:hypothetical protein